MSALDVEYSLLSPMEEGIFLTLSEELKNWYLYGVPEHRINSVSVQGISCYLGAYKNAWPQLPMAHIVPTLCPYFLVCFASLNRSRLQTFADILFLLSFPCQKLQWKEFIS